MSRKSQTELQRIDQGKTAIGNSVANAEISELLAEVGYGTEKMQEGQSILSSAISAYDNNKVEDTETDLAHDLFEDKKEELEKIYAKHRKRAKLRFDEDASTLIKLELHKAIPTTYLEWLETVKIFYKVLLGDEALQLSLQGVKISQTELQETQGLISQTEKLREAYLNEDGESQDATKIKDKSIKNLDKWMGKFFSYAEIALEDKPQLLESLGKFVKS